MRSATWVRWVLGTCVALSINTEVALKPAFAQTQRTASREPLTQQDIDKIQRRLDQLTENHQKLREAIEAIKAELAIVKVRATR